MSIPWTTMDALRSEHGYAAARFVEHWRKGDPIAGGRVESELVDGVRMWRIVPIGLPAVSTPPQEPEPSGPILSSGPEGDGPLEIPLDDSAVHGRTLGALADAGLLYSGDVVRLTKLKGVGQTGAQQLMDWLVERELWVDPEADQEEASQSSGPDGIVTSGEPSEASDSRETESVTPRRDEGLSPATCKTCGAAIAWLKSENGKAFPIDLEPVDGGNVLAFAGIAHVLKKNEAPSADTPRYVSHWATCGKPPAKACAHCGKDRPFEDAEHGEGRCAVISQQTREEAVDVPAGVVKFGDLEVGDEFEFADRKRVVSYRKVEQFMVDSLTGLNGPSPRNVERISNGEPAYFRDECVISFERVVVDLPADIASRDDLVAHCADMPGMVSVVLPQEQGEALNVATRYPNGSWTWAREPWATVTEVIDVEMRPCADCGQHHDVEVECVPPEPTTDDAKQRAAHRAHNPCNCVTPGVPEGATEWVRCANRCGGYVWIEPQPEEFGNEPTADLPDAPERNAVDGELVHVEIELTRAAAKEARVIWPDEEQNPGALVPPSTTRPEGAPGGGLAAPELPLDERLHPALTACKSVGHHPAGTDAWHEMRARGIGSSDAGAIIGVSPHATPQDVWASKSGEPTRPKPWLDDYASFGSWFEGYLRKHCEMVSGVTIIPGASLGTLRSIEWPIACANIDGLDSDYGVDEEIKTSGAPWTEVPEEYIAQVQHQMFVTGCTEARVRQFICPIPRPLVMSLHERLGPMLEDVLAEWLLDVGELVTWIVERDDAYIARLIEREREFWGYVERGEEPPVLDAEGTVDLTEDAEVFRAMSSYAQLASVVDTYKPTTKAADEAKKEVRHAIDRAVALMSDRPKRIVVGDHKATYVAKSTHSYWNIYAGEADDSIIF